MNNRILADRFPVSNAHNTSHAAMEEAQRYDERRRSTALPLVIGQLVRSVDFSEDVVDISSNGYNVRVFISSGTVAYEVFLSSEASQPSANNERAAVEVDLRGHTFVWDPSDILRQLVGRTLNNVFVSPAGLFLYCSDLDTLRFSILLDLERAKPFLFWQFTD